MEITGRLFEVGTQNQVSEKLNVQAFKLDLTQFNQYTGEPMINFAEFQILNKKVDISLFEVGKRVKVYFNISGRFYEKDGERKYTQTLTAWKIEKVE